MLYLKNYVASGIKQASIYGLIVFILNFKFSKMSSYTEEELAKDLEGQEYKYGFVSDFQSETIPKGLNEDVVRQISAMKGEPEWMTEIRLEAFRNWQTMVEPEWAHLTYKKPDFQAISYYSAPKQTKKYESWDDVDPEMKETMRKLGISMEEQKRLTGTAVDFVVDSVSVATSFKDKLLELGIIFCPISEAIRDYPELVKKYIGTVVPATDNFYAALNSAVFTDGSFCYIPKAYVVQWSCQLTLELTKVEQVSLKEHW